MNINSQRLRIKERKICACGYTTVRVGMSVKESPPYLDPCFISMEVLSTLIVHGQYNLKKIIIIIK